VEFPNGAPVSLTGLFVFAPDPNKKLDRQTNMLLFFCFSQLLSAAFLFSGNLANHLGQYNSHKK
jgi:hypothetical protein